MIEIDLEDSSLFCSIIATSKKVFRMTSLFKKLVILYLTLKNVWFPRSVEGYSGIGIDYSDQLSEIQAAIIEAYGNEEEIDWPIVHNAGNFNAFVHRMEKLKFTKA